MGKYYVVEHVHNNDYELFSCNSREIAEEWSELLTIHYHTEAFYVLPYKPDFHLRDVEPEMYVEYRNIVLRSDNKPDKPKLILIQGGKSDVSV